MNRFKDMAQSMRSKYIRSQQGITTPYNPFIEFHKWPILLTNSMNLENYLANTLVELSKINIKEKIRHNLNIEERKALKQLERNKSLIIKQSDKSGTLVILDRKDYITEGERQLEQNETYIKLKQDTTCEIAVKIESFLRSLLDNKQITNSMFKYLNPRSRKLKTPEFYHIAKIHKNKTALGTFPGRPIISGIGGPTERISQFVDYFLNPIAQEQSTYLKDSKQLIQLLESSTLPNNVILVAGDIESMYNNIEHGPAVEIVHETLLKHKNRTYNINRPNTDNLTELFKLVVQNNVFKFNGNYYKQEIGLAMGSKTSPSASDIVIYHYEMNWITKFMEHIHTYKRYRDDIFILWKGPRSILNEFIQAGNSMSDRIKFDFQISNESINFLDLCIYKGTRFKNKQILDVRTFSKPTNKFQYLDRRSAHQDNVFKAVIKGEITRHLRNTSNPADFSELCTHLQERLLARNYSRSEVDKVRKSTYWHNRSRLIWGNRKKNRASGQIMFKSRFDPRLPQKAITRALNYHWDMIKNNADLNSIFPSKPQVIFLKNKTIGNTIVRAVL